jgi:acyl-CoA thioester hydrolase
MSDYRFFHPMEVRYGDLDPQGHLNNAKYLTLFEQARVRYWTELGLFSEDQSFAEIGVILADVHIRYQAPVRWGTALNVGVRTVGIGFKSLTVEQCILNRAGVQTYADGTVVLVAYDYGKHASMRVPDAWRERLESFEARPLGR